MNPYVSYVQQTATRFQEARSLPLGGFEAPDGDAIAPDAPKVLIFSPHPDDECIIGLLPLRLMREAGMRIVNIPVTFGSNSERQPGRAVELRTACAYLGWDLRERDGLEAMTVQEVVGVLEAERPAVICFPHAADWNSRHISTHHLVMSALQVMPESFSCTLIETEFWGAMDDPNLMVEGDVETVADLVAATSFHVEEVKRNPYHLSLPAWMQDNVRRGGELVGGQGGSVPEFTYATLYRLSGWEQGTRTAPPDEGRMIACNDSLKDLVSWK
jgi:LmbE family N-acetylglucosaminyl deacetylase